MSPALAPLWPWFVLAGLGVFHGINPAMGWLFAVALGLQRDRRSAVLLALIPIALGHALAVAVVLLGVLALGRAIDTSTLIRIAAVVLIGWAAWHAVYGHRHRVRIGMQTGLAGLVAWSFLTASGHGAGLMLIPMLGPICGPAGSAPADLGGAFPQAVAALAVHTSAMLLTIAAIAVIVYEWAGVDFLRRGWINLDLVWVATLGTCGLALLVS